MHVVVIHGWREETVDMTQAIASALGIMVFEVRQRMIGGGPAVVATFADPQPARALAAKLNQANVATLVVDATAIRSRAGLFIVRRFVLGENSLHIEADDGQAAEIPYGEINLLLPGTCITGHSETISVTERKFSLGKTILSGGIPMMKKVEHKEEVASEEREKVLHLYAGNLPPVVFSQNCMTYDGLGAAMKLSRELNFTYLMSELRRLSLAAIYDDRLLTRVGQVRILGPAQNRQTGLYLAAEILARTLLPGRSPGPSLFPLS